MWTLCYCVGVLLVGAAARSSIHYPRDPRLTSQESLQSETKVLSDDVPILNSGMNIHERGTDEAEIKESFPTFSSGMNIKKLNDKQEANDISVNDETKKIEENDEQWFSTKPAKLEEKKIEAEKANNEEVEDEINVQVNVDTAAEVSTEIRRPQIIYSNGKMERKGKLLIKINVKTNKDEPKPFDGFKDMFNKDQNDYDQKTCDWLNELITQVDPNNPRDQRRFNRQQESKGPQGPQRSVKPQGTLRPQRTLPQHALGPQRTLRLQRTLPQHALKPQRPQDQKDHSTL